MNATMPMSTDGRAPPSTPDCRYMFLDSMQGYTFHFAVVWSIRLLMYAKLTLEEANCAGTSHITNCHTIVVFIAFPMHILDVYTFLFLVIVFVVAYVQLLRCAKTSRRDGPSVFAVCVFQFVSSWSAESTFRANNFPILHTLNPLPFAFICVDDVFSSCQRKAQQQQQKSYGENFGLKLYYYSI